jgi:sugar lactone lactonase YvrE
MSRRTSVRLGGFFVLAAAAGCGDDLSPRSTCSDVPGTSCTWAGVRGERGFNGDGHHRQDSWLGFVADLTFAPDGKAWVVDYNNHRIRRVEDDDTLQTMIGAQNEGDGALEEADRLPVGDPAGAPGTEVSLNHPTDIEFLPDGSAVIAAWHNNKIRTWDAATGIVKVLAGNSYGPSSEDVEASYATFNQPKSVALDDDGQIYLVDQRNLRVRLIDDGAPRRIHTVAGVGTKGYAGDGGLAMDAQFSWDNGTTPAPNGALVLDGDNLYIADTGNHRIRRMNVTTGAIDCIAGNGVAGVSGDGGAALEASLGAPFDLEIGPDGRLYVADALGYSIRAIDLATGTIERVAGNGLPCTPTLADPMLCLRDEEGADALDVQLSAPYGIAFDRDGNLYIADTNNSRVVRIAR